VMKTPTNRIEMIPMKIRTQRKKNGINPTHN
jgi:spore coat polysaccharide biosynthesis predicted glycosyltransferase SpsG